MTPHSVLHYFAGQAFHIERPAGFYAHYLPYHGAGGKGALFDWLLILRLAERKNWPFPAIFLFDRFLQIAAFVAVQKDPRVCWRSMAVVALRH